MKKMIITGNVGNIRELTNTYALGLAISEKSNKKDGEGKPIYNTIWVDAILPKDRQYYQVGDRLHIIGNFSQSVFANENGTRINTTIFPDTIEILYRKQLTDKDSVLNDLPDDN